MSKHKLSHTNNLDGTKWVSDCMLVADEEYGSLLFCALASKFLVSSSWHVRRSFFNLRAVITFSII